MNYLKDKMTYLAGPIQMVTDKEAMNWRDNITPILEKKYSIIVQDPCKKTSCTLGELGDDKLYFKNLIKSKKYEQVKNEFYKIIRYDLKCVDRSDFIIVYHDPKIPTVGTWHEIINCINKKSPVLVVCPEQSIEYINPWLLTLIKPQWLFTSFDDMILYLDKINNGEIDSSHWW